jgi:protein SCO1/2
LNTLKNWKYDALKVGSVLFIFGIAVLSGYYILTPKPRLPIINPADINPALVDDSLERVGRNHRVGDFSLYNQDGEKTTQSTMDGKIYVADFFFATCPTICIDMAKNMRRLQATFAGDSNVMLVSFTVYPENDSVPVLRAYADAQQAIPGKWIFLTGEKKQIYDLARKHYFAVMDPGTSFNEHDFIHTDNFVLVDAKKRIRGIYKGTDEKEIDKLESDIRLLLSENESD